MSENKQSYEEMIGQSLLNQLEEVEQETVMQYFGEIKRLEIAGLDPEDAASWDNPDLRIRALEILGRIHEKFKGSMPKGKG